MITGDVALLFLLSLVIPFEILVSDVDLGRDGVDGGAIVAGEGFGASTVWRSDCSNIERRNVG